MAEIIVGSIGIVACSAVCFMSGYMIGKHIVYKKWSDWLDRMIEIQKGCKNGKEDNHK